eukprot:CAMPEP_0119432918 /NCGR_PEP_ID=MMETSP1335-20130426/48712_1 /TAXON_ID=259385 /ORGANISM="Chrysoculter rhomboideus, Strain RCC1486" /LENGTH=67 /DNA_ID=CAMNT_0007458755 /DNA_START=137 /DNA_END=337 /DNA_ORIENTATION=-
MIFEPTTQTTSDSLDKAHRSQEPTQSRRRGATDEPRGKRCHMDPTRQHAASKATSYLSRFDRRGLTH